MSKKTIEAKREYNKIYSKEYRKNNKDKIKAYLDRSKDHRRKVREKYYEDNQEYFNKYSREYRKRTKNAFDKSGKRKYDALIRSNTRHKYPLEGKKCEFCPNDAQHRHHTTEPMEVDKFLFLCEDCHDKVHGTKRYNKKCSFSEESA